MKEEKEKKEKRKGFFGKLNLWRKRMWYRHKLKILIIMLILAFLLAYFWRNIFISIYPGHAGVMWKRFFGGTVTDKTYGEGLHIIFPWDKMYDYSLRVQQKTNIMKILTAGGLYVDVEFSYRFHPERSPRFSYGEVEDISHSSISISRQESLPLLHKLWGPHYVEKFVEPETKAAMIAIIGNYPREELQKIDTYKIQADTKVHLDREFLNSHIILHDFMITRLTIPKSISDAIEKKLTQEQLLQEYAFRLQVESKEKERKEIEAQGIQLFETISGIPILKWRGLDVTSEIARSNNAKVIVIGTGAEGLPVILNAEK